MNIKTITSPTEVYEYLDDYVAGNQDLKKNLSVIAYLYNLKVHAMKSGIRQENLPKLNMFVSGHTGTGKTYSISKMAEVTGLPFKRIDMSHVQAPGCVGAEIGVYLKQFLEMSPEGYGIIFLDEFDKRNFKDGTMNGFEHRLQHSLLDLLDGNYDGNLDPDNYSRRGYNDDLSKINNALVFIGGSFESARSKAKSSKMTIGFQNEKVNGNLDFTKWKETIIKLGFIPELINRIQTFTQTEDLTRESIKDIILNKKGSSLEKFKVLLPLAAEGLLDDIENVVDEVKDENGGMRGLDTLVYERIYKTFDKQFINDEKEVNQEDEQHYNRICERLSK